jgi:hypothetical protein
MPGRHARFVPIGTGFRKPCIRPKLVIGNWLSGFPLDPLLHSLDGLLQGLVDRLPERLLRCPESRPPKGLLHRSLSSLVERLVSGLPEGCLSGSAGRLDSGLLGRGAERLPGRSPERLAERGEDGLLSRFPECLVERGAGGLVDSRVRGPRCDGLLATWRRADGGSSCAAVYLTIGHWRLASVLHGTPETRP